MFLSFRFWLGFGVTAGFLFLFLWKLDFEQTGRELLNTNYAYFIPAVLFYYLALAIRAVRWHYLLLHLKSIPSRRLYPIVAVGYLSNNILPMRLGELVRAHFLGEKEGVSKASALATIGVERVLDGLTLLILAAVIWPFLPWTTVWKNDAGEINTTWVTVSVILTMMFIAGFVVLFLFATSPSLGQRLARTLSVVLPLRFRAKAEVSAYLLIEGLGALRSPRKLLIISILSAPVWLAEAVVYYIVAISFDLELPFHAIVLVTVTSNLATAIPSSIGGIGPFEVVAKTSLVAFGVGAEAAAAYSFFVHILALWLPVNILGLVFLWKENMSLAQLARSKQIQISFIPESSEDGPVEYADGSVATAEGEGE